MRRASLAALILATLSAAPAQEVEQDLGIPVAAVARLQHLIQFIEGSEQFHQWTSPISDYRQRYGVAS